MVIYFRRVDRILILFDANKLDISDELRRAILAIKNHDEKVRPISRDTNTILIDFPFTDSYRTEQVRPGDPSAADARVRGADVEPGQGAQHARGGQGLHWLLLGQAARQHRMQGPLQQRRARPSSGTW